MSNRFKDKNYVLYDFINELHLVCPECNHKLIAKNNPESYKSTIACTNCGFRTVSENKVIELSIKTFCNNCGEKIKFSQIVNERKDYINIRCNACNASHKFEPKISEYNSFYVIIEKYGLWYTENFRGNHFWAYNDDHLKYIENYIKAGLRQRHNRLGVTLVERLPKFVKSAKNRNDLIKLIEKMRKK